MQIVGVGNDVGEGGVQLANRVWVFFLRAVRVIQADDRVAVRGENLEVRAVIRFVTRDLGAAVRPDDRAEIRGRAGRVEHVHLRPVDVGLVRHVEL